MRPTLALAVVAVVVLAGCSGLAPNADDPTTDAPEDTTMAPTETPTDAETTDAPTPTETPTDVTTPEETATDTETPGTPADGTPTATPTPEPDDEIEDPSDPDEYSIQVDGGQLGYDANVTFARVQGMLGTNMSPPNVIIVQDLNAAAKGGGGRIIVNAAYTDDESVMAHEFTHSIQRQQFPETQQSTSTADAGIAMTATIEGSAEYIQNEYARRYLDEDRSRNRLPGSPGQAYLLAPYVIGSQYIEDRIDDPSEITDIYENPPNTTEQIMHGYAPAEEVPTDFIARVPTEHLGSDADWTFRGQNRLGELVVMLTLRTRIPEEDARTAAAGWGNDQLVEFVDDDGRRGFVWVTHWDDAEEADEAQTAFEQYVEGEPAGMAPTRRQATPDEEFTDVVWGDAEGVEFRTERVDDRTVALVFGPSEFVTDASAERDGDRVIVSVG